MKHSLLLLFGILLSQSVLFAQTTTSETAAAKNIQLSQAATSYPTSATVELKIPAGTPIEVEVAYTVNSLDVKPGERISFRVLVPIMIDGSDRDRERRPGDRSHHRARSAADTGERPGSSSGAWKMWWLSTTLGYRWLRKLPQVTSYGVWKPRAVTKQPVKAQGSVKGTSHVGEVATMAAVSGVLFPPLALLHGFKRGENAILREGRRYVVAVGRDATVKVVAVATSP